MLKSKAVEKLQETSKKWMLRIGLVFTIAGIAILSVFAYKHISRELYKQKLLKECVILEIPNLNIKVPVMDGTDKETLSVAAGHFEGTGSVGKGNYCIAGHNSTVYAEIFNELDQIQIGDEIYLIDNDDNRTKYIYVVSEYNIVNPQSISVLDNFGDDRLTVITCTDDGKNRQVVIGKLK